MTDRIDPVDLVERLIEESLPEELVQIPQQLQDIVKEMELDVLRVLIDEEDRDERLALVDLYLMFNQQLAKAHQLLATHLSIVAQLGWLDNR